MSLDQFLLETVRIGGAIVGAAALSLAIAALFTWNFWASRR